MPVLTNVIEIVAEGTVPFTTGGAKVIQNVFHYQLQSGTPQTAVDVAKQFRDNKWVTLVAQLHESYTGVGFNARYIDDALENYTFLASTGDGLITGDRLPMDMAVACVLRCAARGKNFRGSKHFTPLAESDTLKDELTSAAAISWNTAIQNLFTTINLSGAVYIPVVVSKTLSQLRTNPCTVIGSPITSVLLNKTIGTMRRRRQRTSR